MNLTSIDKEILEWLSAGLTNEQIGIKVGGYSGRTVQNRITKLYHKFQLDTRRGDCRQKLIDAYKEVSDYGRTIPAKPKDQDTLGLPVSYARPIYHQGSGLRYAATSLDTKEAGGTG